MRGRVLAGIATIGIGWAGAALAGAGQQGIGQSPSSLPLTPTIREKGSSVTARIRRLVLRQGRQPEPPRRLLQPQHQAGARHSGRTQQPHRARRAGYGPADALRHRPPVGRLHHQAAEGFRDQEADVDHRRQRPDECDHAAHPGRLRRRTVRGRGEQEHAAEAEVPRRRPAVHGRAGRHRREIHRHGWRAAHADGVGDRRGREDQRAGRPRPWPRRGRARCDTRSGRCRRGCEGRCGRGRQGRRRRRSRSRRRGPRRTPESAFTPPPPIALTGRCSAVRAR